MGQSTFVDNRFCQKTINFVKRKKNNNNNVTVESQLEDPMEFKFFSSPFRKTPRKKVRLKNCLKIILSIHDRGTVFKIKKEFCQTTLSQVLRKSFQGA